MHLHELGEIKINESIGVQKQELSLRFEVTRDLAQPAGRPK